MSMLTITLIAPPSPFLTEPKAYPPLGLLYLAAALRKECKDIKIDILDLSDKVRIKKIEGDLVGFSVTTPQINRTKEIIERNVEDAKVILGGPHPTALPYETLYNGDVWAVVRGYGERMLPLIVNNFKNYSFIEKFYLSDFFTDVKDLDWLPMPAWDLLDLHSYKPEIEGGKAMNIYTSRGCPYDCNFCTTKIYCHKKVWFHSPERVLEEVKILKNKYEFDAFVIGDDNFLLDSARVKKICGLLGQEQVKFRCIGRVNHITQEVAKVLKEAGCTEISFGIESGSNKMLKIMNKKATAELAEKVVKICKEAGLIV